MHATMRGFVPLLAVLIFPGCASILNSGGSSTEFTSDPPEATVYVNGNERGSTPYHYTYTVEDGSEVTIELRKPGYHPTSIAVRPKTLNHILFADAMLLGIPYIMDKKDPRLYRLSVDAYRANLYKEMGEQQRQLVPIAGIRVALGEGASLGTLNKAPIRMGSEGTFRDLGYPDALTSAITTGLRDTWVDAKAVRMGSAKGDEWVQRAKLVLVPELETLNARLTGQRRKCHGSIELGMRWKFMSGMNGDSLLFERHSITSYDTPGDHADQALHDAIVHAARRLSEDLELPGLLSEAYGSGLSLSKGSELQLSAPKTISFEGRKDMLSALVKGVVTIQTESGHGSGFVITNDGYLLSNQHVVGKESVVKVKFEQGFTLDAQVVKTNPDFDLALLKVPASDLPALAIGNDAELMLGEEIFAIGTPMETALGQSVSRGILSGRRELEGRSFLQTDVSINPGNSGGPLIDESGQVVGVATMKISGKGLEGLGFGVPISVAMEMLNISFQR